MSDGTFNGGLLNKAGDDTFRTTRVHAPTGDILRANRVAVLGDQHLCAFPSQHWRRNRTDQACARGDGIKDIFGHTHSCQWQDTFASYPNGLTCQNRRQHRRDLQCIANDVKTCVLEDRRIPIFTDGENRLHAVGANHMLDLSGDPHG